MKLRTIRLPVVVLLMAIAIHGGAQTTYYPDSTWQSRTPNEVKMKASVLDSAVDFAVHNKNNVEDNLRIAAIKAYSAEPDYKFFGPFKHRGKPAGLIIKNGYIVAQWGDVNRVDMTFSVTKSYLSTIAGLAYDQHLIKKLDDRLADYVTEEKNSKESTMAKSLGGIC